MVQLEPQVQLKVPLSKACGLLLKVSVSVRVLTEPPPTFVTVPCIGYVIVGGLVALAVPGSQDLVTLIAQVLKSPSRMALSEAGEGLLPDETDANMMLLKQGTLPPRMPLRSIPPSWNCN